MIEILKQLLLVLFTAGVFASLPAMFCRLLSLKVSDWRVDRKV